MKSCFILVSHCLGPVVFYETSQGSNIIVPDQKTCSKFLLKELCHIICNLKKAKTSCPGIQLVSKIMV